MGNLLALLAPRPVDTPPRFGFPPLADRTRMLESSYNMLFGKLPLKSLFEDYFDEARHFTTRIMLKPLEDPRFELLASGCSVKSLLKRPLLEMHSFACKGLELVVVYPHRFVDVSVSNAKPNVLMRICTYYPEYGFGTFGVFPLLWKQRLILSDDCFIGYRYASTNLSVGATHSAFSSQYEEFPRTAWLVSKIGNLTAGVQYEPKYGSKGEARYKDLENWSCAVSYGVGSGSPLRPSFNFGLELNGSSQFIASFYQHLVVQRQVMNPHEENNVGITNHIDFGFELQTRIDDDKPTNNHLDSSFQVAASWQANQSSFIKGKVGTLASSLALAFKSWWKPSFSFSLSAVRDHIKGETAYGFGIHVNNIREGSYERADPKFVMLTRIKEYFPQGIYWRIGDGRYTFRGLDGINRELRSLDKVL